MRKLKPRLLISSALVIALVICVVVIVRVDLSRVSAHFWRQLNDARVTYKGQPSPHSVVYRSGDDKLLVVLDEGPYQSYHVVFRERRNVGTPNASNFYFLPGYAYCKDVSPPSVMMGPVKGERWAELLLSDRSVEFNGDLEGRVRVDW